MRSRSLGLWGALILLVCLVLAAVPASSQAGLDVRIREANLDPAGLVRLVATVTGPGATDRVLTAENFVVTEEGEPVRGLVVKPLLESEALPVAVALAIDVSGSTAGRPLADAKTAAKTFVRQLPPNVQIAIVSFGPTARTASSFTTDRARLTRTLDGLQAGGDTSLYDGIVLSTRLLARTKAQHNIVLFSDGKDTVSRARLSDALRAARSARAPVTSVGLVTPDFDSASLDSLAQGTGGRSLRVGQSSALAAAFRQVAKDIASQYVLLYSGSRLEPNELDLAVTARVGDAVDVDRIVVLNPRVAARAEGQSALKPPPRPLVGAFSTKTGLYVGIGGVALAVALFFGLLLYRVRTEPALKVLRRGLRLYTTDSRRNNQEKPTSAISASPIGRRATELIERVPRTEQYAEGLQTQIDRAGWPLRWTELVVIQIAAGFLGLILGFGVAGKWWLALILMALGLAAPRLALLNQIQRRSAAFLSQLPDTLQLLAGSLQAGYGFMQAIDTLVKESPPPTSTEFSRVLTEARLGMPVDEAMTAMADRLGNEDFRWVVLAINIQRQVGGNLAVLLQTVANTLREREQVRRQIKVLSAEGKLSAIILTVLPFAIAGYVLLVNPGYLDTLFSETLGKIMIAGALTLMGLGMLWMRKIIRIDV